MTDHLSFYRPLRAPGQASEALEAPPVEPGAGVRERQKAAIRTRIVDAGFEVFWSKGYERASVVDIAQQAGIAPATFYRHFHSKAEVALEHNKLWLSDFVEAMEARPERETPDQMVPAALVELAEQGYASSRPMLDETGRPIPTILAGLLLGGASAEIAGRIAQLMVETEWALAALFARRLGYPEGALEPLMIGAAIMAGYRVSTSGYLNMLAAGVDPPPSDEIGLRCGVAFTEGLRTLWSERPPPS